MPETTSTVRWPDGDEQSRCSPSLVVHGLLEQVQAHAARCAAGEPATVVAA